MAKMNASDVWDLDPLGRGRAESTFVTRTLDANAAKAKAVRDDWDDDEEEEEQERQSGLDGENKRHGDANMGGTKTDGLAPGPCPSGRTEAQAEEDSHTIWEEANKRTPMPEFIVASASTGHTFAPPPPAALQPTLRILKRSSPSSGAYNVPNPAISSGLLSSSSPEPTSGLGSGGASPTPRGTLAEREAQYQEARSRIFGQREKSGGLVTIVRDPLGPASEPEQEDRSYGLTRLGKGFGERRRGKVSREK